MFLREMPEYNSAMANTFCSLNIHCIFSTKERVPMLNPEAEGTALAFLGRNCQTKRYYIQNQVERHRTRTLSTGIPSVSEAA
jgi:hypothetical protein